jgi:hypothetical protein
MNRQEDTIDLKTLFISTIKFLIQRKKTILFGFLIFIVIGLTVRILKTKSQKDLYEINYLFESTVLPKETMLSIVESIIKNKDQYENQSFKNVNKIDVKTSDSLVELSVQSNTVSSIESCENFIDKKLKENLFIQQKIKRLNQLLIKVKLSIEEIEQLKLSKEQSMSSLIEKLFYQNQSKTLVDLYKEKQKIESSTLTPSGLQLVSKSTLFLIEKFSFLKETLFVSVYGIFGALLMIFLSLINFTLRKIKSLNFK